MVIFTLANGFKIKEMDMVYIKIKKVLYLKEYGKVILLIEELFNTQQKMDKTSMKVKFWEEWEMEKVCILIAMGDNIKGSIAMIRNQG
jgi:hypothetical protein